jgi:transposase
MEMVLDVYKLPFDSQFPVVCMDESPKQLIGETKIPIPASKGRPAKHDYEYRRCGVCNIFMACEPLSGKRMVKITERKTKKDWSYFLEEIAEEYKNAERITLVMDNLNTHTPGSFYETFQPNKAKALWDRFEFVYTPKHGSWINMAEIESNYHHQRWWLDIMYLEGTLFSMLLIVPQTYLFCLFFFFLLPSYILPNLIFIETYGAHTISP